jgi:hypothetical protein
MNKMGQGFDIPRKIFEFNIENPVVKTLAEIYSKNKRDGRIRPIINQLFENCLLSEGDLPEPALMVPRLNKIIEMMMTGNVEEESEETINKEEEVKEEPAMDDLPEEDENDDVSESSEESSESKQESSEEKKE